MIGPEPPDPVEQPVEHLEYVDAALGEVEADIVGGDGETSSEDAWIGNET